MVVVAGDSGVGKSSLCRAGVLPRVAEGHLGAYLVTSMVPGRRPVHALAACLAPLLRTREASLAELLLADPDYLGQTLRHRTADEPGIFLFIDHLEELVTDDASEEKRHFAAIIAGLAVQSDRVRVLLGVRGDFLTRLISMDKLGHELERAVHYFLRPLSPEGIREAIVLPARRMNVSFEGEALVAELVASGAQSGGSLPLLQFALAELWDRRDKQQGRITAAALQEMGRVGGALGLHGDRVLRRLSPEGRNAAREILLSLVSAQGTRRRRTEAELIASNPSAPAALSALREGRLLSPSEDEGRTNYEIAHEALLQGWGTLRGWIDADRGNRPVKDRISAAAEEWRRLGKKNEALFGAEQLAETALVDPNELQPAEREFLQASDRAVKLRRRIRIGLALAGFAIVVIVASFEIVARRVVTGYANAAREALASALSRSDEANRLRAMAFAKFKQSGPDAPGGDAEAEETFKRAVDLEARARTDYMRAAQSIEPALVRDPGNHALLDLAAEIAYDRISLAERTGGDPDRAELEKQLHNLDVTGRFTSALERPAALTIRTNPPAAAVTLRRYTESGARWALSPGTDLGTTPLAAVQVPQGSYLLTLTAPNRVPVRYPLLLAHGETIALTVDLPTSVPAGFAYIPPGCFLYGSGDLPEMRQSFFIAWPIHRLCMDDAYLIGRREVTFADWMEYLESLPPAARAARMPRTPAGRMMIALEWREGDWRFSFMPTGGLTPYSARRGEIIEYPGRSENRRQDWTRFPVVGVSLDAILEYLKWTDRTGRVPGARLCREDEWERAARGADGRHFPTGDELASKDANFSLTYGQKADGFGLDEVGIHTGSDSPFGISDLAGNAWEWTQAIQAGHRYVYRGSAWFYDKLTLYSVNRAWGPEQDPDSTVGFRVCSDFPPHAE